MSSIARSLIIMTLGLSISVFYPLSSITHSFSQNTGAIEISIVDSGFVPLTNTDANQVRVNVGYTIEDESLQNEIINAVMKVYDPDGTLIRTTSIPGGFTAQTNGGVEVLRTNILDKSMQSVSININFTDLAKENALSNTITEDLELETASFDSNNEVNSNNEDNNSGSNDEDNDNSNDDDNDSRDDDDDDSRDEDDGDDGGDKDCSDFDEKNFKVQPGDPHGLDRDGDGIACET